MLRYVIVVSCLLALTSCGGGGTKFAPNSRETSMSDSERAEAITQKKQELNVSIESLINTNDVKLNVMPPMPNENITEEMSERIAVKMLEVIAANGVGGLNNSPGFALGATMTLDEKKVTGTVPQKTLVNYSLNYKVFNSSSGDVYASTTQKITGVGESDKEATLNAINSIKNLEATQRMLAMASEKIIKWYDENFATFVSQVEQASGNSNYALALALVESVPQKAEKAFAYAQKQLPILQKQFKMQNADKELAEIRKILAESSDEINPSIYAHIALLPTDSPEYKQAQSLCESHEKKIAEKKQKEYDQKEAVAAREQQIKLANIEADKLKAQYEAAATEQALRQNMREQDYERQGFFGSLGSRLIGAIDKMTNN